MGKGGIEETGDFLAVVVALLFLGAAFHVGHMIGRHRGWMDGVQARYEKRDPADEPDY